MSHSPVSDKRILITGAANGLGRELSLRFASRGAEIVAWDVDVEGLGMLERDIRDATGSVTVYDCDVAYPEAIESTAARVLRTHGSIDVLVNNAGVVSGVPFMDIPDEWMERTFAVNTLAHFRTVRAFLPGMLERGTGHIVTVASAAAIIGTARMTDYAASKFAVFGFEEALRTELRLARSGIRTTVVCPFFFRTKLFPGIRSRVPWLLPVMETEDVATRTVRAVERGRRRVIMPRFVYVTYLARLLPVRLFDRISDVLGVSRIMESFAGDDKTSSSDQTGG